MRAFAMFWNIEALGSLIKRVSGMSALFLFVSAPMAGMLGRPPQSVASRGLQEQLIVDSAMRDQEAFDGLSPKCPERIRKRQKVLTLSYYSFDEKLHQGQLVVDASLEGDIRVVFDIVLAERFPLQSVIPISHPDFRKKGGWDDGLSMAANNTSGFNYRLTMHGDKLSFHAYGRAIDINPVQNPFLFGRRTLPPGAKYDRNARGALTADHAIVRAFLKLGWKWGGNFIHDKDYQHFEKPDKAEPSPRARTARR